MTKQTKSPPRSEPVTGCLDCGSPAPLHNKGCSISSGAIKSKSMSVWVQWGIRRIGEFDLCSAKYSERIDAEKVLDALVKNRLQGIELVSITVKPVKPMKPKKRRKQIVYGPPPSSILELRERNRKLADKLFPHPLSAYATKKGKRK